MPSVSFGDVELAWGYGPGLAHACNHFKNPDKGKRSAYTHRVVTILDGMRSGRLEEEEAVHQVLMTTAAFLSQSLQEVSPITVSATSVDDNESINQPESDLPWTTSI